MSRDCPQCGSPVAQAEAFCGGCGDFLGWQEETDLAPSPAVPRQVEVLVLPETGGLNGHAHDGVSLLRRRAGAPTTPAPPPSRPEQGPVAMTPGGGGVVLRSGPGPVRRRDGRAEQLADDGVAVLQRAVDETAADADRALAAAADAAVGLERTQRRGVDAQRRVSRLTADLPAARLRVVQAEQALRAAESAASRARRDAVTASRDGSAEPAPVLPDQDGLRAAARRRRAALRGVAQAREAAERSSPEVGQVRFEQALEELRRARREEAAARVRSPRPPAPDRGRDPDPRRALAEQRAGSAERARDAAAADVREVQQALATLEGVLAGARGEVRAAPAAARAAREEVATARRWAQEAQARADEAATRLQVHRRLLRLRAQPLSITLVPEAEQARLDAELDVTQEAQERTRRATAAEARAQQRAAESDRRRASAEARADSREFEVLDARTASALRAASAAGAAVVDDLSEVLPAEPAAPAAVPRRGRLAPPVVPLARARAAAAETELIRALSPVEVRRRQRVQAVPLVPLSDGPVLCPSCATGNAAGRHLCRCCGVDLAPPVAAAPEVRAGWWRRSVVRVRGRRAARVSPALPVGARPVPGGGHSRAEVLRARVGGRRALDEGVRSQLALPYVAGASLLALLVALVATPLGPRTLDRVRGGTDLALQERGPVAVVPLRVRASSAAGGFPATAAVDKDPVTAWVAATGNGAGQQLVLEFAVPTSVVGVRLSAAGGSGRARPAGVSLSGGLGAPTVVRMENSSGLQTFEVQIAEKTLRLVLTVEDVFPADGGGAAGFAEVQLLKPRGPRGPAPSPR